MHLFILNKLGDDLRDDVASARIPAVQVAHTRSLSDGVYVCHLVHFSQSSISISTAISELCRLLRNSCLPLQHSNLLARAFNVWNHFVCLPKTLCNAGGLQLAA